MTATITAAAVQATPVFLDRDATVNKAAHLVQQAAADGAQLVAFPEAFVPTYPDWVWRTRPWADGPAGWYERLVDQAVNSDLWVPTMRHIAREGRIHVLGVSCCLRGSDVPADIPGRDEVYGGADDWLSRGNSCIVGPDGDLLAGPLVGEEGIVLAELDLDRARVSRRQFDPVGHYARPDVFRLHIDRAPKPSTVDVPAPQPSTPDSTI